MGIITPDEDHVGQILFTDAHELRVLCTEIKKGEKAIFPSPLYKMTMMNRIRWNEQARYGYRVYRLLYDGKDIGYTAVSDAGSKQYPYVRNEEAIVGPSWMEPEYRCRGLSSKYLNWILMSCEVNSQGVWANISRDNTASIRHFEKCGFFFYSYAEMDESNQMVLSDHPSDYVVYYRGGNKMEELRKILEEVRPDVDFTTETQLIDGGVLDSLDIITIVSEIYDTFDVMINVNELMPENFNSMEAIWQLIQKLKKED